MDERNMNPATLTNADSYEHIYLASEEPEQAEPTHIDAAISRHTGQNKQTITIFNGEYLGIRTIRKSQPERFHWLPLAFVDSTPTIRLGLAGKLTIGSLIGLTLVLCALLFLTLGDRYSLTTGITGAALLASVLGIAVSIIRKRREYAYETLHGRLELFRLAGHGADDSDMKCFRRKLQQILDKYNYNKYHSQQAFLCEEMKQHQRLFEEGMFSQAQFTAAKCLILGAHDD